MKARHLMKRGEYYSARYVVPVKYRAAVGAATLVRATGTTDEREAARRARRLLADMEDEVMAIVKAGTRDRGDPRWLLTVAADLHAQVEAGTMDSDVASEVLSGHLEEHLATRGQTLETPLAQPHVRAIKNAYKRVAGETTHSVTTAAEEWRKLQLTRNVRLTTIDAQQRSVAQFSAWAGDPALTDINTALASQYVHEVIIPLDRALATKRGYLIDLAGFGNWVKRRGWTTSNPWHDLSRDLEGTKRATSDNLERHWRAWSEPELERLTALKEKTGSTTGSIRPVGMIALWTGMRTNEVCELLVGDIDLKARTYTVREGKTDAARRTRPYHSSLHPLMLRLTADGQRPDSEHLIAGLKPTGRDKKRSKGVVNRAGEWIRAWRAEGDDLLAFYGLRATFSTALLRASIDTPVRMALMAHAAEDITTRVYAAAGHSMEQLRQAIEKIDFPTCRP